MVAPKSSFITRKEMKVPKKPLASWTTLVAMTSVPICARIDPVGRIGLHRLAADCGIRPWNSSVLARLALRAVRLRVTLVGKCVS
jgi:hypothetical protein